MFCFLAAVVVAAASPAPSATPSPPPSIGSTNVVTGSPQSLHRAPQPASVFGARAIRASTSYSLDDALRSVPAVDRNRSNAPFTNYGQLRLSFTGSGADRGTLLVDGVPAQDGFGGQVDWNAYPMLGIENAQLLRGPGSALYGSGAIGGVLSLSTIAPSSTSAGTAVLSGGGIDRGSGGAVMTTSLGTWSSALTIDARRLSYGVIPPGQTSSADRPAISTADVANLRLRHTSARSTLDLGALLTNDAQQDGRPNDGFSRAMRQASATWTTTTRDTLALTAFARATTVVNLADRYPTAPGTLLYTQHVPTSDAGFTARYDVPYGSGAFSVLATRRMISGANTQNAADGTIQSNVAGTQRQDGVAVQQTWTGTVGGVVGVRYDAISTQAFGPRYAAALSPRAGIRVDLSPAIAVRAAYGTGLRAPYLNELIRSFRVGTILEQNNPALTPERSASAQMGFDIASASSRLAIDVTDTRVSNAIGFATIAPNVQQRSNLGSTATQAYIVEYERPSGCTGVRGFATYQHDRVISGSGPQVGKRLAYVPDDAAALDVYRTVGAITGTVELSYTGPTFADDLEQQPLGSAFLVGGRISWRAQDGTTLSLAVENLADKVYLTSVDRLGAPSSVTLRLAVPVGARVRTPVAACG